MVSNHPADQTEADMNRLANLIVWSSIGLWLLGTIVLVVKV
jgi:hypothetical protein